MSVDDQRRRRGNERARHQHAPLVHVGLDQAGHGADGEHLLVGAEQKRDRIDERGPGDGEREDRRRDDAGQRHRDEYFREDLHVAGAVDQRRFVELLRDRLEIADHDPGAERHGERRIDQDHAPIRVQQAEPAHDLEQRDEQQGVGNEVGEENAGGEKPRSPEPHARKRKRGEHAHHHGDGDHAHRDDDRVLEVDEEVGFVEEEAVLLEGHAVGDDPRIGREMRDLGVGFQRRHDHVVGRREKEDREQDEEEIGGEQRPAPAAPQAGYRADARARGDCSGRGHPISLPRLRTPRRMNTAEIARIGNMNSDTAAPSGRSPERMPSRNA